MRGGEDDARGADWCVLLGAGPRLEVLEPLLRASAGSAAGRVRILADLAELLGELPAAGRVVLDVDHLPQEDIGLVRRFLQQRRGWSLWLVGEDAGRRSARQVLALPGTHWLAWPPDLDQLQALALGGSAAAAAHPQAPLPKAAPPAPRDEPGAPAQAEPAGFRAPRAPQPRVPAPAAGGTRKPPEPGPGLAQAIRGQVGSLADIAQRLELALGSLREGGAGNQAELEPLHAEVQRLVRATRGLALLARARGPEAEPYDLARLVEEELAALTLRGRRAPRFLFRSAGELPVRADRAAVGYALDAALVLARACAGAGEIVRVHAGPAAGASPVEPHRVQLAIDFPAGPLRDLPPAEVLEPGRLREQLPDLAPTDLGAARALLEEHDGELELAAAAADHLVLHLRLPGAGAPLATVGGGEDPFA